MIQHGIVLRILFYFICDVLVDDSALSNLFILHPN